MSDAKMLGPSVRTSNEPPIKYDPVFHISKMQLVKLEIHHLIQNRLKNKNTCKRFKSTCKIHQVRMRPQRAETTCRRRQRRASKVAIILVDRYGLDSSAITQRSDECEPWRSRTLEESSQAFHEGLYTTSLEINSNVFSALF